MLLKPGAVALGAIATRGRQVCSCFDVSEAQIDTTLAQALGGSEQRLARLQEGLRCGTNCGSCLPELQRLVRRSMAAA
jgi:assimilatory nitrate reductase catalytic subunit